MNETTEDLLNLAQKFLNIHPNLDPRVFDKNGKIHELLRLRILHRADYMAQEIIKSTGKLKRLSSWVFSNQLKTLEF